MMPGLPGQPGRPCPNCPDGYDCSTGNYWTPAEVDNPTIGQALCLDNIHEADGSCCTVGRDLFAPKAGA